MTIAVNSLTVQLVLKWFINDQLSISGQHLHKGLHKHYWSMSMVLTWQLSLCLMFL